MKLRHLDLFSGIGGFALAARMVGIETVGFCEIDPWARRVLEKNFSGIPVHDDVRTLETTAFGRIDLLTGGYPCQPFTIAGKREGEADDRHLWPAMHRVVEQARPTWVVCENVAGHITLGLDQVLLDLESIGYTTRPFVIPACAVDAPHRRDRVWIVAHRMRDRSKAGAADTTTGKERRSAVAIDCGGPAHPPRAVDFQWSPEPDVGRVADGIPYRVDRLRGLGNAIVPQVAAEIFRCVLTHEPDQNQTSIN